MKDKLRQTLLPLITSFIWGAAFVAQEICAENNIEAFTFNTVRYLIAVIFLSFVIAAGRIFGRRKKTDAADGADCDKKTKSKKSLIIGGILCGAALAVASNFQQAGMSAGTDAGKAGFITALYVVLVPIFGLFFGKKTNFHTAIAVVLSVAALYLLCIKGSLTIAAGDALILICAVCFAGHILIIDRVSADCDGILLSTIQFLTAGLLSGIGMFIFEKPDLSVILSSALPLLYAGVFSCGIGYTLQIIAQKNSNPTVTSVLLSMESLFSVITSAVILHHKMTVSEYIGCALMLAAVIITQIPTPAERKRNSGANR